LLINYLCGGAVLIQGEQARENFIVRKSRFPTVGGEDGLIKFAVSFFSGGLLL
jgi:hypothetical protein